MELGIYTFADAVPSPLTGEAISPAQRLRNLIEEIEVADQVGLDIFGVGEHHRPEYAVSAPAVSTRWAILQTPRKRRETSMLRTTWRR
jgi:alkanesulfonate monooxygenase SsuD/methylene tetrahydromethanopterin reductase-like flavin-dependent oxidoreductase (luciferase family)